MLVASSPSLQFGVVIIAGNPGSTSLNSRPRLHPLKGHRCTVSRLLFDSVDNRWEFAADCREVGCLFHLGSHLLTKDQVVGLAFCNNKYTTSR